MIPTSTWISKPHTHCRVCEAPLGSPFLDLGEQPLANALVHPEDAFCAPLEKHFGTIHGVSFQEQRYPLQVILCEQCGLSQLSVVVNPEVLYARSYPFQSGVSGVWRSHCEALAEKASLAQKPGFVIDIAANDGTQLAFLERWGWRILGIEPAQVPLVDFGAMPYEKRAPITMLRRFWSEHTAKMALTHHGQADLIIAQNVLGHVDDPIAFLRACKTVLAPKGRIVVEVPYVHALLAECAFDTIYHEHLSYWGAGAMGHAAHMAGLDIDKMESLEVHGGSVRFWMAHIAPTRATPRPFCGAKASDYATFAQRVEKDLKQTGAFTWDIGMQKEKFLGWGASAKAAVYLNALAPTLHWPEVFPSAVIDECPEKQGMLMPGVHIPVIPPPDDLSDVDVIWCLSWNNAPAIKEKAKARGFKGKFLLTNGTPRLED